MHFPQDIPVYGSRSYRGVCLEEKYETEAFFTLLHNRYPKFKQISFHVRNEGKLSGGWRQANRHRKEGKLTGAADIVIPGNPYSPGSCACVIELKRKDHSQSKLSVAQEEFLVANKDAGVFVAIALGADAAMCAVEKWMELCIKHKEKKDGDV